MAWRLIQMAYLVSMPTFISCMEKEKGMGLLTSVDLYFLPVSFESLRSTFSCFSMDNFSETWLTMIMNCPLQPLTVSSCSKTEQGIQ